MQERFEAALRRALDGPQPGGSVVTVRAPDVTVTPTIKAELPSLPQPLQVLDVARHAAAFEWLVTPVRNAEGFLVSAKLTPVALVHFGENT